MKKQLNDQIEISFPETFHVMNDEEMKRQFSNAKNRIAAKNDENHTVLSVGWSEPLNLVTGIFVTESSFLDGYYKRGAKGLKNFKKEKSITNTICGREAKGFAFSYLTDDGSTVQNGAVTAFKRGKRIYIVEYISGSTDMLYCNMAYDMVIGSIKMINKVQ